MWKVVVTEIQDASVLEPTTVPPGAFFVNTERFSRTIEDLDLDGLIDTINRMQSAQVYHREERPVSDKRMPRRTNLRAAVLREAHGTNAGSARTRAIAATKLSQIDP